MLNFSVVLVVYVEMLPYLVKFPADLKNVPHLAFL